MVHRWRLRLLAAACFTCVALLPALPRATVHADDTVAYQPNSVLVTLKKGTSLHELMAQYGLHRDVRVQDTRTFHLTIPNSASVMSVVQSLNNDPRVVQAEPDWAVTPPEGEDAGMTADPKAIGANPKAVGANPQYIQRMYGGQWAVPAVGLDKVTAGDGGMGLTVAVLDTGVQTDHPALQGHLTDGYDFVAGTPNVTDPVAGDDSGHGTFIAGLIALVAPQAQIMPVRVLDENGNGDVVDVANGIYWAVDHGANIINLSLGTYYQSDTIDAAIHYAESYGVIVVAAAGNDDTNQLHFPSATDGVLGVAALDELGVKADFSNFGAYVSLSAPGTDLYSTYDDGGYAFGDGTSFATGLVSGVAALAWSAHPELNAHGVENLLVTTSLNVDAVNPNYAGQLGAGEVDAANSVTDRVVRDVSTPTPEAQPTDTQLADTPTDTPTPAVPGSLR